jgi:hypothetical protein
MVLLLVTVELELAATPYVYPDLLEPEMVPELVRVEE